MKTSTLEVLTTHVSSVPDREFDRPKTIDALMALAHLGSEIIYRAIQHVGFEYKQQDAWAILNRAQSETVAAHGFICAAKFVGLADWEKVGVE